jgi:group II intron reverse transcriptase/maturase
MVGVLMLPETIHRRLASVPNLSRQGKRINGLFRLLDGPELWQRAYEEIAQNQGALTPGSTPNTLDGFSLERVENIIRAIKEGRYRFAPVRRIHIPKPNGKTRPLGIPTADDKLVQAAVKLLLELVYEPVFSDHSHGFRRQRSCHTALDQIRRLWNGTKWIIEVDVVSFFDNISHSVLLRLLSKRIDDKRFLNLIENMLKAGVMEDWEFKPSYSGTPQGGVASPILANIYLHELDQFMAEMKADFDQGKERRRTPEYRHLKGVIGRKRAVLATLKAEGADVTSTEVATLLAELEDLEKRLLLTPSADPMDPGYRRLSYCRYADDFVIGVIGSRDEARKIMDEVSSFLQDRLDLQISEKKSGIHKATEGTIFLGYRVYTFNNPKVHTYRRAEERPVRRRTARDVIQLRAPREKLVKFVERCRWGNLNSDWAEARPELTHGSDLAIITAYNAQMRGFANYYRLANQWRTDLSPVHRLFWFSLMKTLANKHRTSVHKVVGHLKTPDGEYVLHVTVDDGEKRSVTVVKLKHIPDRKPIWDADIDRQPNITWTMGRSDIIDRLKARECLWCGATDVPLEVHHVRKLADVKNSPLWKRVKAARTRKRIPLCRSCHQAVHRKMKAQGE